MESGIKHSDLRYAGHDLFASTDTREVVRIVERAQLAALLDCGDHLFVDDYRAGEFLTAVQHAVSNRGDLGKRRDHAVFLGSEGVENDLDCFRMIVHVDLKLVVLSAFHLLLEVSACNTDTVCHTFCQQSLVLHIDQLILDGRTSCIDYENFHFVFPPYRSVDFANGMK